MNDMKIYILLSAYLFGFLLLITGCDSSRKQQSAEAEEPIQESPILEEQDESTPAEEQIPELRPDPDPIAPVDITEDTIIGRWIRPDGNYVLEITSITEDKNLEAAYFNPRPINIALAEIKAQDGIRIYVEFDDTNYEGSYYDLRYDPVNDALAGNYYQATYGQTYQIAFIRMEE